jgi:type IV secretion system protein VirB5
MLTNGLLPNDHPAHDASTHTNPYLDGRREWQERTLDLVIARRNWQRCAGVLLCLLGVSMSGNIYLGTLPKTVPFTIQVTESGQVLALGPVPEDQTAHPDDRITAYFLHDWVRSARSIFGDWDALKQQYDRLYAFTQSPATDELTKYYSENDPSTLFKRMTVTVAIRSVLRLGPHTWQVRWTEERKGRDGQKLGTTNWEAVFTLTTRPPASQAEMTKNPFGLFVTQFTWTQAL